jgi:hypothetical protein
VNRILLAAFGWFLPGGGYLLRRRYVQFALFAGAVWAAFALGLALHGAYRWPRPAELAGIDGFTAVVPRVASLATALAGAPYLLAQAFGGPGAWLDGRLHEHGTTLLMMGGVMNALGVASALDLEKERSR